MKGEIIHETNDLIEAFLVYSSCVENERNHLKALILKAEALLDFYYHANLSNHSHEQKIKEDLEDYIRWLKQNVLY